METIIKELTWLSMQEQRLTQNYPTTMCSVTSQQSKTIHDE